MVIPKGIFHLLFTYVACSIVKTTFDNYLQTVLVYPSLKSTNPKGFHNTPTGVLLFNPNGF